TATVALHRSGSCRKIGAQCRASNDKIARAIETDLLSSSPTTSSPAIGRFIIGAAIESGPSKRRVDHNRKRVIVVIDREVDDIIFQNIMACNGDCIGALFGSAKLIGVWLSLFDTSERISDS